MSSDNQVERRSRDMQLIAAMSDKQSPVSRVFSGLKWARRWLRFTFKETGTSTSIANSMLDAFLHEDDPNANGSALETIIAETVLNAVALQHADNEGDVEEIAVYMETRLKNIGDGVNTQIRAGIIRRDRPPHSPAQLDNFYDMPLMDRHRVAAEIGHSVLDIARERVNGDGEKELYFEEDEVYAHYGLALEKAKRCQPLG